MGFLDTLSTGKWWADNLGQVISTAAGALLAYFFGYKLLMTQQTFEEDHVKKERAKRELAFLADVRLSVRAVSEFLASVRVGQVWLMEYRKPFDELQSRIWNNLDFPETSKALVGFISRLPELEQEAEKVRLARIQQPSSDQIVAAAIKVFQDYTLSYEHDLEKLKQALDKSEKSAKKTLGLP